MNRPFQFRLRTVFVVVAIIATACALASHARPSGFVILAYSSGGLVIGSTGIVATERVRKKTRQPWNWVPMLMGVCSGILLAWSAIGFLAIIFLAFMNQFFPTTFG
jgi:hypothetical protein